MEDVRKIARYLYVCYFKKISQKIDEMKMHKLLYAFSVNYATP